MSISGVKAYEYYKAQGKKEIAEHILEVDSAIWRRNNKIKYLFNEKANPDLVIIQCDWCGKKPSNHNEVLEINHLGVCGSCIAKDHVMADVMDIQRGEYE